MISTAGVYGAEKSMMKKCDIRKCVAEDIARVGQFYDSVIGWLNGHVNYPRWVYGVYPSERSVETFTEAGAQYVCGQGGSILGAFALNAQSQGSYQKGQ